MGLTLRQIHVRCSLGNGNNTAPPLAFEMFRLELDYASPRSVLVKNDNADEDMLALQAAALAKVASMSSETFMVGNSVEHGHVIDPDNPGTWTSGNDKRGIVYAASSVGGPEFFIGFEI